MPTIQPQEHISSAASLNPPMQMVQPQEHITSVHFPMKVKPIVFSGPQVETETQVAQSGHVVEEQFTTETLVEQVETETQVQS